MACRHAFLPEEDLSCPVCCDIFRHPVLLPCSHSICQICLWQFWKQKGSRECPICRRVSATDQTPCNLALKNLCESFLQNRSQTASFSRLPEVHCIPHKEQFKLFCLDDEQPVCLVCQASRKHSEHTFLPIDEAAQDYKGQLQTSLKLLQEKLRVHNQFKLTYHQTSSHIKIQAQDTERQIRREFEELQQFLRDEQAARLTALKAEERQKSRVMREKIEKINKDIGTLSDTVRPTEKEMRTEHALFLQNFKATMERAQYTLPDLPQQPDCVSGCLINVAEHLGNLKFRVWEKMKNKVQYTSVILDPNSAHPRLILSRDLTSISFGDAKQLPDNAERFDYWECVVGSGGLDSGCHCWDVEVGDSKGWDVGVTPESNQRKGISFSWERVWRVGFRETGMHYSGPHLHKLQQRLQRVQAHHSEKQIKEEFEKLHQFLKDEEEARIRALKEEEQQKSLIMKEKTEELSKEMSTLSDTITAIKKQMVAEDIIFLQNFKATIESSTCTLPKPQRVSGALIDVAKHLGNLRFRVWEKMKDIVQFTPVVLDPNTANSSLIVSKDLTSLEWTHPRQTLPDNPERFNIYGCVLGSEGFNSGSHYWDVEVGDSTCWCVDVTTESNQRKRGTFSWERVWRVGYDVSGWLLDATGPVHVLEQKLDTLRVHLDLDKGQLSFSDPLQNTHLHTFKHTFTEKVLPFFFSFMSPLSILPLKPSVTIEQRRLC